MLSTERREVERPLLWIRALMKSDNLRSLKRRRLGFRILFFALSVVAIGVLTAAGIEFWGSKPTSPAPAASRRRSFTRFGFDESGYTLANSIAARVPHDPTSLESIRTAFEHLGHRGIASLRPQKKSMEQLLQIAVLQGYEGEFEEACQTLGEARASCESDPVRYGRELPTIIFLQGVMALRRGEVENCVECACQGSCIFPLRPTAFHGEREGSSEAIKYFSEYLEHQPKDMGVRWLLNVAYMTLGQYPEGVPAAYRIPLDPFRSEFDIGRFVDRAPALGLNRLHRAGGAIMDDFDNDGLLDLVETSMDPAEPMAFYRNRGDGTFENRAKEAGLESQLGGLQCMQTDYNNDGWLDVFVCRGAWTAPQRPSLLRNNKDGTFTDATREAGLLQPIDSQVAVWADYDNDGFLDLFLGGETVPSRLYHNKGDGTFEEVAARAGVTNPGNGCKGANWGDFDGDGYPDLFVCKNNGPPHLYRNNGDGTFTDYAIRTGITEPRCGFSCWFWDYDNDGWLDLFATSFESQLSEIIKNQLGMPHDGLTCYLYRNRGGKSFVDVSKQVGLNLVLAPMGSNFADFDGDGFLDFYLGTGSPNYSMLVPNRMFKNVEGRRFADITVSSGTGHLQKGHGVACGDWDRNGSIDLFVQMGGAVPGDRSRSLFFQNPSKGHRWITVRLVGKKSNRPAIGARIKATLPSGQTIYRHVTSGSSFGANPLQQTIGLGSASRISSLEIYWPTTKTTQIFHDLDVNQAIEIVEFDDSYRKLNWTPILDSPPNAAVDESPQS